MSRLSGRCGFRKRSPSIEPLARLTNRPELALRPLYVIAGSAKLISTHVPIRLGLLHLLLAAVAFAATDESVRGTVRSRRSARSRSRHSFNAVVLPSSGNSTALQVRACASPLKACCVAWAARFRDPRGRPAGSPERPFSNGLPRCFCCSSRKFTATGKIFFAEILGFGRHRARGKQRRRSLFPAVFA